ncbi:MAG: DUF1926 domain-containing protein [Candidatus Omnitrophica bacterium]|nr:DUF1926 domain-containing protein [Candidatus Omnitrophota bacterium]
MRADLLMGIHFHQPVGNFDHIMERACDRCYIPFLETVKQYPDIRMSFHFTGCLLEWIGNKRPEMIGTIRKLAGSGQIEIMSGGFYEPILSSIPPRDRLSQILMLNEYVRTTLACEPRGAWVAERVWEPDLPSVFHDAAIKYVILDDTHFLYAGVRKDRTYGYYVTEDNGRSVAVFPSDRVLRYHIPFKMPEECVDYMRGVALAGADPTFVYGDDGEKFGEWPGTNRWVYEEGWLRKFFDELMKNRDWLNTMTFSESLEKKQPLGRVYLPAGSYEEMLEWALPADSQEWYEDALEDLRSSGKEEFFKPFFRGGFWRNFLTKYPESNHMNKKMIYVSGKVQALREKGAGKEVLADAEKDLFRGQCNCAYWHGVFGGLYLSHLRSAVYHHLIRSEAAVDRVLYGEKAFCSAEVLDMDADGFDEAVLENRELALYFAPHEGGILKELDSKAVCHNLMNILTRRKEAYHRRIIQKIEAEESKELAECQTIHDAIQVPDAGIREHLVYDRYERYSLIDHFLGSDVDIDMFSRCSYPEAGDFIKARYDLDIKRSARAVALVMKRIGKVNGSGVSVLKKITLPGKGARLTVEYIIHNISKDTVNVMFAPELNLTMPEAGSDRYALVLNKGQGRSGLNATFEQEGVDICKMHDANGCLSCGIAFSEPCRLWHFPVRTVSQSEKAYELNYQSSAILPAWRLDLRPGGKKKLGMEISVLT